ICRTRSAASPSASSATARRPRRSRCSNERCACSRTVKARWCSTRSTSTARCSSARSSVLDLLREVVLGADLLDELELRRDPVDVAFLGLQHVLEQLGAGDVALVAAQADAFAEALDRVVLHLEIELELLLHVLADGDLVVALHVGHALEEEDALDEIV